MVIRIFKCDKCGKSEQEPIPDMGVKGWGAIQGVALNGVANPLFCPSCLAGIMGFVDSGIVLFRGGSR